MRSTVYQTVDEIKKKGDFIRVDELDAYNHLCKIKHDYVYSKRLMALYIMDAMMLLTLFPTI